MSLTEKLENVVDRDTFLEFVKALIEDWKKDQANIERRKDEIRTVPSGTTANGKMVQSVDTWNQLLHGPRL